MIKNYSVIGISLLLGFLFIGCAQSRLAKDYGNSYRLAREDQTLNPEAEKNLESVYGFDGQASERTIGRYRKSFEKAVPPPMFTNTSACGSMGTGSK